MEDKTAEEAAVLGSWTIFWYLYSVASVGYLSHNLAIQAPNHPISPYKEFPKPKHWPVCIYFHLRALPPSLSLSIGVMFILLFVIYVAYQNNLISENSVATICVSVT